MATFIRCERLEREYGATSFYREQPARMAIFLEPQRERNEQDAEDNRIGGCRQDHQTKHATTDDKQHEGAENRG